jgi:hypothetical protein
LVSGNIIDYENPNSLNPSFTHSLLPAAVDA